MRPAAEVADVGLELVERGLHVVAEPHHGDRLHGHRTNHDVRLTDRDVEGCEPLLDQATLLLQLVCCSVVECPLRGPRDAPGRYLVQRHPEWRKKAISAEPGELGG